MTRFLLQKESESSPAWQRVGNVENMANLFQKDWRTKKTKSIGANAVAALLLALWVIFLHYVFTSDIYMQNKTISQNLILSVNCKNAQCAISRPQTVQV